MAATFEHELPLALAQLLPPALQGVCATSRVQRGERLFRPRAKPRLLFYVAHGEVVLQRLASRGELLVLQRVRQGFVAEASLHASHYHCEALVTSAAELVAIPIDPLKQALATQPGFAISWIAMLNQELRRLRAQCERLALKGVAERLLHLIETEGQGGSLALEAGLKSVAAELGVSHEALYRSVATLERQGLLQRTRGPERSSVARLTLLHR